MIRLVFLLLSLVFLLPLPAQEDKLGTEKILTIPAGARTRFTISNLAETGTYFLRAINQGESPVVFYIYENDPFTLIASNNTKNDTYEETLALPLSKEKSYQVIFSPLRASSKELKFSLVKSSLGEAFESLSPIPVATAIRPADESVRSLNLATFTSSRPLYSYDTAMYNDELYIAHQERVADQVIVSRLIEGEWEVIGEPATGNQEKISSFKLAISSEGKIYLAFLSSPIKNQVKLNITTFNGYHWVDISPSINGALGDIFDFSIRGKALSLLYALPLSKDTYTLQVLTNQGFGREWLALSPLEPSEKVSLEGMTLTHSPDLTIAYNIISGRDKLSRIMTYKNSQWVNLEAPAQVNSTLHTLISTNNGLIFADITAKGLPSLQFYRNNAWQAIPLKLEFPKPLSLSVTTLSSGAVFLSLNSLNNFLVLVSRDRNSWQYVGNRPFSATSTHSQFLVTNSGRAILSYQKGRSIIFDELELK